MRRKGRIVSLQNGKRDSQKAIISVDRIGELIYLIRGQKVMLDSDLAELYGVETKVLKRTVKRNYERFPEDFVFQLNNQELKRLRCQNGTSKRETRRPQTRIGFMAKESGSAYGVKKPEGGKNVNPRFSRK